MSEELRQPGRVSAYNRFKAEVSPCQPWFSPFDMASGRVLDIPASFCPNSTKAKAWKVFFAGIIVFCQIYNWTVSPSPRFYLAFVTNWSLVLTTFYSFLSAYNSFFPVEQPASAKESVGKRIKLTWAIFCIATNAGLVVPPYYWAIDWSRGDPVTFASVTPHGVTVSLLLIDGLLVNRIPTRVMMWLGLNFPYVLTYIGWTLIHAAAGIGNPNVEEEGLAKEDEAIYSSLNWNTDPLQAAIYCIAVLFVLSPLFFYLQWFFGANACCCCLGKDRLRYIKQDDAEQKAMPDGVMASPY